ncbi:BTAD domain-containing putative transcriptional regulator [Nocardia sp. NPDC052566]|uniref:BTAD domain-containing putative transcriptional regulator n=1 Tax=Nocardia sp. NPDC052566 TaxID=3364330 RepID=UPI0037C80ACC
MAVTFGVLGSLRAEDDRGRLALKGPRHHAVLARLLIARGRVVPVATLIDDLWETPPDNATGALQTFVAALRRILEPHRPPRAPATLLVTAAPGYALAAAPDAVDAWRFETAVGRVDALLAAHRTTEALADIDTALALWHGPAYAEFADQGWARAEITRLDGLHQLAVEHRARALTDLGRAPEAVLALETEVAEHPLREQSWHMLALALYRAGRQADALTALRTIRTTLRTDLGVDPSPDLTRLEADILSHAPHLTARSADNGARDAARLDITDARDSSGSDVASHEVSIVSDEPGVASHGSALAGRDAEPARRLDLADALPSGGPGVRPQGHASVDDDGGLVRPSGVADDRGGGRDPVIIGRGGERARPRGVADYRVGGARGAAPQGSVFVGRDGELARLLDVADAHVRDGLGVVLISGAAGAGKSTLASVFAGELGARGWTTAWGENPADQSAPPGWPWTRILDELSAAGAGPVPQLSSATGDVDPAARFRAHRAAVAYLARVAAGGPLLLVLDDLHDAGEETLDLLTMLVVERFTGSMLVVGTYRTTESGPALSRALARIARAEPARVYLGGLAESEVGAIVADITGAVPEPRVIRRIHQRSGGNPFFVRELARLLRDEGVEALDGVPPGVREVIRYRLSVLPEPTVTVLRRAAVLGNEIDPTLLVTLIGDAERTFDAMETAVRAGLLIDTPNDIAQRGGRLTGAPCETVQRPGPPAESSIGTAQRAGQSAEPSNDFGQRAGSSTGPPVGTVRRAARSTAAPIGRIRFAHDLIRDTVYEEIARPRRARWHGEIAELMERTGRGDLAALAHHFLLADSPETAARAAYYGRHAAHAAERAFAPHEAARVWRTVIHALDRSATAEPETRLDATMGLVRALAVTGDLDAARRYRGEAIRTAEQLGDPEQLARVVAAFDVPALWTDTDDPALAAQAIAASAHALPALPADQRELRSRLLTTMAIELRGIDSERGRRAAAEAEAIARELGDPAVLAFALNGRYLHTFQHAGLAGERAAIAGELIALADTPHLVTFEVLGHLIGLQSQCALADFTAADRHAAAVDRLGEQYDLPLTAVFTQWYRALRHAVSDDADTAEAAYRSAATQLAGTGMPGVEHGLPALALCCVRLRHGRPVPPGDYGPYEPWIRPLALLDTGDHAAARTALAAVPDSPPDLLVELRTALLARAALALGDTEIARRAYIRLLPAAAELAGAGSGLITLEPVAYYLGDLAALLGEPETAAAHHRDARALAGRAGAAPRRDRPPTEGG